MGLADGSFGRGHGRSRRLRWPHGKGSRTGPAPRWVAANALGELVGLGGTGLIGFAYYRYAGEPAGVPAVLAAFGVAVGSGVVEATVLGLAQHWAVRPWLPALRARRWWFATLWGALAAYVLGWLPSTSPLARQRRRPCPGRRRRATPVGRASRSGRPRPRRRRGAGLRPTLELRRHVAHAWRWIPANMLAWAVGMPWSSSASTSWSASSPCGARSCSRWPPCWGPGPWWA